MRWIFFGTGRWTVSAWWPVTVITACLPNGYGKPGVKVLGYGEGKTPVSLVRSCSVFLYADRKESKAEENTPEFFIRRDMEYFDKAFEQAADGKEEVSLSLIGGALKKNDAQIQGQEIWMQDIGQTL